MGMGEAGRGNETRKNNVTTTTTMNDVITLFSFRLRARPSETIALRARSINEIDNIRIVFVAIH